MIDPNLVTSDILILALGAVGLGMIMLIKGGDWTIDAAVYIATKLGVSPLVVGFTIVAFGTSLPELVISVNANLKGSAGIALGNVIGSNIANILLVIGVTALVATLSAKPKDIMRDMMMMIISSILFTIMMVTGHIDMIWGVGMLAVLLAYVIAQYYLAMKDKSAAYQHELEEIEHEHETYKSGIQATFFLLTGLIFIAAGAEILVRGAQTSATIIGIPDAIIGLTVIAIGTSLPELSTCIIAAMKKQSDIVIGNILGSNVFNILMIIGVTAVIKPIVPADIEPQLIDFDIWVMMGTSLIFAALLLTIKQINKPIGFVFCLAYTAYIGYMATTYLLGSPSDLTGDILNIAN